MEKFIRSLPRPFLVIILILIGTTVIVVLNPPHTVCDTETLSLTEAFKGVLWPVKEKNKKFPPKFAKLKESCLLGVSSGACYDYLNTLKMLAKYIERSVGGCSSELYNVPEVKKSINDGLEIMVLMAWGDRAPEPGLARIGWFQDFEVSVYCSLKAAYQKSHDSEDWQNLTKKLIRKLPLGSKQAFGSQSAKENTEIPAISQLAESDIWARSLFSVRCENYR